MEKTIETAFRELDELMKELESGDRTLEESMALYRKGMELVAFCNQKIDRVEKQLIVLQEGEAYGNSDQ